MTSSGHSFSSNRIPFKGLSALVWSNSPEAILNLNACDSNHPMPQDLELKPNDASVLVQSLSQLHRLSQASHDPRESGIKATGFGLELCPAGTQPYPPSPLRCTRGPAPPPRLWEGLPSTEDPVRGFLAGTRRSSENQEPLLCVLYLLPRRLIWVPEALCPPTFRLLRLPWLVTAYVFCAFTSRPFLRLVYTSTSLN